MWRPVTSTDLLPSDLADNLAQLRQSSLRRLIVSVVGLYLLMQLAMSATWPSLFSWPVVPVVGADTLWGVILAQSGGAHVLYILLFAGYFSQLPRELEEAAIMDLSLIVRVFAQVMLPLATPIMATVVILQFINSWNDFLLPLVLTLSRPDLRTLAVGMYAFRGEYYVDWSGMAAAASISLLPVILVFLFMQRYFVEGIAGAVKQ